MNKTIRKYLLKAVSRLNFCFPDKLYLEIRYYLEMGKRLNLAAPKTMNEKLQWLKLYNRRPEYTQMVDKVLAKQYAASIIGDEYIVRTLGVWNHFDEIDFSTLPDTFVLKTNHSGGNTGVVVCPNKDKMNRPEVRKKLETSLRHSIFGTYREWPYKNVERKILAEEYLGADIMDYKFYCFDGYADVVLTCIERGTGHPKFYFFDRDWKLQRLNKRGKAAPQGFTLPKPDGMDKMFELAGKLSSGLPFARVDMYNINGKIYFGEITLFPASGFDSNRLPEADVYFGEKIFLPEATTKESK